MVHNGNMGMCILDKVKNCQIESKDVLINTMLNTCMDCLLWISPINKTQVLTDKNHFSYVTMCTRQIFS